LLKSAQTHYTRFNQAFTTLQVKNRMQRGERKRNPLKNIGFPLNLSAKTAMK